jgi:hypothetical protein
MILDETSDAPPAANGTISVMLRSGHFSAEVRSATRLAVAKASVIL